MNSVDSTEHLKTNEISNPQSIEISITNSSEGQSMNKKRVRSDEKDRLEDITESKKQFRERSKHEKERDTKRTLAKAKRKAVDAKRRDMSKRRLTRKANITKK